MALTGIHVTCAFAGARGFSNNQIPVIGKAVWAETIAFPGPTTNQAPAPTEQAGTPVFQITSAVDVYVAIGLIPDATGPTKTRYFVKGGQAPVEIAVAVGDKLTWVDA